MSGTAQTTPLRLSALLGQDVPVESLAGLVHAGGPVPPLLLHGPAGVGKRTAALAFAAALVCRNLDGADACGACAGCRRVAAAEAVTALREGSTAQDSPMVYPDVGYVSVPKGKTRLSIVQVRDIVQSMASSPYELGRRIYVVDPADRLNAAAANALLKVLEEPPSYGVLMLVTSAPWSLPITVRSRLRPVAFRPLPPALVERILTQNGLAGESDAAARAAVARGSVARAVEADPAGENEVLETWVRALERLGSNYRASEIAAALSEELAPSADAAAAALDVLLSVLRDVAADREGAPALVLDEARLARLRPRAGFLLGAGGERPALVDRLRRELVVFNRNPRLSVEGAVLCIAGLLRRSDLPA